MCRHVVQWLAIITFTSKLFIPNTILTEINREMPGMPTLTTGCK
ncbi:unnamed protein product [Brugia timori]|uniref:Uncharacterized protein n=1 Tax=Brugia timori TaxID=42155 RepID=A0A0R3QGB9_9BILA|nr:unnamed protein product [Brugia timori]